MTLMGAKQNKYFNQGLTYFLEKCNAVVMGKICK